MVLKLLMNILLTESFISGNCTVIDISFSVNVSGMD